MPGFKIKTFKGKAPKVSPRLLGDGFAQKADNCFLATGDLVPYKKSTVDWIAVAKSGDIKTLYKFGSGSANGDTTQDSDGFWFHWNNDVDVVRNPAYNDSFNKIYFTGEGTKPPQVTDSTDALAGAGTAYPVTSTALGLAAPTVAPTISSIGGTATSSDPLTLDFRYYVYTFVDASGGESAPSPVSSRIATQVGEEPILAVAQPPANSPYAAITRFRLYVTTTGSSATDFQLCKEDLVSVTLMTDAGQRSEVLPTATWQPPETGMVGLTAMSNGIMAGFEGSLLMFSEPYAPYAWPVEYQIGVDYEIVGLGVAGDQLVVCTKGNPYLVGGATSAAMSITKIDIEQACVSKRSIVSILNGVMYASPDGLVYISAAGVELKTEPLMTRMQWQALKPSSIHAYQHDNLYYGFYDNGTTKAGFILDPSSMHFVGLDQYATAGYNDLETDALYLALPSSGNTNAQIVRWDYDSADEDYLWKSKKYVFKKPLPLACGKVIVTSGSVTVSVYADGVALAIAPAAGTTLSLTESNPVFRLPPILATDWEVEVSGTGVVEAIILADSISSLKDL